MESHLLQMRGLKLALSAVNVKLMLVASFTDAWIETKEMRHRYQSPGVASFTDAWIETEEMRHRYRHPKVASFTDAWIETSGTTAVFRTLCRIFYRCVD